MVDCILRIVFAEMTRSVVMALEGIQKDACIENTEKLYLGDRLSGGGCD